MGQLPVCRETGRDGSTADNTVVAAANLEDVSLEI
jgi:hypothetical protein